MKYKVIYEVSIPQQVLETKEFIFDMEDAAKLWVYYLIEEAIQAVKEWDLQYNLKVEGRYTFIESASMDFMVGYWEVADDYGTDFTSFTLY